jgi:predicted permease
MRSLRVLLHRLRALFQKPNLEQQLDDEIHAHLEMQIEDYQRQGMTAEAARYAALRKFGGVDQVKETYRDRRGIPFVETLFRDLTYGLRMLRRSPGTTIVAVLSLAFGIGVNTALFSAVDAVLLQTLPVREPEQLIVFNWQAGRRFRINGLSGTSNVSVPPGHRGFSLFRYDVFTHMNEARLREPNGPLSDLFAFGPLNEVSARFSDHAEIINGQAVTGNYYAGLGLRPILGRAITDQDDAPGAPPVVVLSNKLWREQFGASPDVVGRELTLNKQQFTIIGVDPPAFSGAMQVDFQPAITIALEQEPLLLGSSSCQGTLSGDPIWWLNIMGRLKPDATPEQARESVNGSFQAAALEVMPPPRKPNEPAQLDAKEYPRLTTESGSRGMPDTRKDFAPTIYALFIVVAIVLLIACANLANLLLARGAVRGPEISVRLAMGAGRWRIVRQLLTESLLLSVIGGVVGVLFAFWARGLLVTFADRDTGILPAGVDLHLNWRVLLFTFALSVLTGLLFGVIPAWRTTSLDLATALKQSRRTASVVSRASKLLLVGQVALSSLLLLGAGLFIHSLYNLQRVEVGFNQNNLLLFTLRPMQYEYKDERLVRLYQQVFDRLDQLPGVRSATFGSVALIANDNWYTDFRLPGEPEDTGETRETMRQMVRENYFATMEIPFLRGRQFTTHDGPAAPNVAIVNETFAQEFFLGQSVLGQRIAFAKRDVEIVGVVADTKYESQRKEIKPLVYTPWQQEAETIGQMHFAVRTDGEPTALAGAVRQLVRDIDNDLPVMKITTQAARAQATLGQERLYVRLLSFFGAVALLLAAIGLFGVLAHSVSQRTKEIGIRMAFGAQVGSVLRLIIWEGMKLVLSGLALATLLGFALKRLFAFHEFTADIWERMKEQLYGVSAGDPITLIVIVTLLMFVALLACWLPARRAAKVDPLVALRYE